MTSKNRARQRAARAYAAEHGLAYTAALRAVAREREQATAPPAQEPGRRDAERGEHVDTGGGPPHFIAPPAAPEFIAPPGELARNAGEVPPA